MRVLILGGTGQLGRALATAAARRGHEVTCLARGRSGEVPDAARLVVGDREHPDGLAQVAGPVWDAVVDVTSQPGQARRAVTELSARHRVLVSTVSVYAGQESGDENDVVVAPLESDRLEQPEDYPAAKAACEQAVLGEAGADSVLVVRPGLIGGPEDDTDRSGYWPYRMSHPVDGQVLVPDAAGQPVQLIDVRDLADWIVHCVEERTVGIIDAVGPQTTLGEVLAESTALAPTTPEPVVAASAWLLEHGVAPWMGPRSLPLWLPDPATATMMQRSGDRARAAGLRHRSLRETLHGALEDAEQRGDRPWRAGLSEAEERDLIRAARD